MASKEIDELALRNSLAYPTGGSGWDLPEFASLKVYCRGDKDELSALLASTPFELESDLIVFTLGDSRSGEWYKDGIKLPYSGYLITQVSVVVRFGETVGNFTVAAFGTDWRNLMGNYQFLGSTARPADISLTADGGAVSAAVTGGVLGHGEGELLRFGLEPDETSNEANEEPTVPSKSFNIRMVPSLADRTDPLSLLEIYTAEGGVFTESEKIVGKGHVEISSFVFDSELTIREVEYASFRKGHMDFSEGYSFNFVHRSVR